MTKIITHLTPDVMVTTYYYYAGKVWITFALSRCPDKFTNQHAYSMKQAGKNHIKMSFDLRELVSPTWWNLAGTYTPSKR